mmetsp:Transcript_98559/g.267592  ORF Transcript_98559/g.267592 Transcript_98559/m.267592 type:complete len:217 (+) Transcript_98559:121-771(+)
MGGTSIADAGHEWEQPTKCSEHVSPGTATAPGSPAVPQALWFVSARAPGASSLRLSSPTAGPRPTSGATSQGSAARQEKCCPAKGPSTSSLPTSTAEAAPPPPQPGEAHQHSARAPPGAGSAAISKRRPSGSELSKATAEPTASASQAPSAATSCPCSGPTSSGHARATLQFSALWQTWCWPSRGPRRDSVPALTRKSAATRHSVTSAAGRHQHSV